MKKWYILCVIWLCFGFFEFFFAEAIVYFPLKKGYVWKYNVNKWDEKGKFIIKEELELEITDSNSQNYFIFSHNDPYSELKQDTKNFQIFQRIDNKDYLLFNFNAVIEEAWVSIPKATGKIVSKQEKVVLSKDIYNNCIKIELKFESLTIYYFWFAQNIGLIKQEKLINGQLIERKELYEAKIADIDTKNNWGMIKLMFQK